MKQVARTIWSDMLPRSPVFTTADVASAAGTTLANASRDLTAMTRERLVTHVRRGLWAVTSHPDFSPYAVVPYLFRKPSIGYVSLLSALNLHGMIDQIPAAIQVITTVQRPSLDTPVGRFEFYQIQPELFGGFQKHRPSWSFDIADSEKALFDALYLSARKRRRFSHLPELELPTSFPEQSLFRWISRVRHPPLRRAIEIRWEKMRDRVRNE